MTRRTWTTDSQREWLEAKLATFREAQHTKSTASAFFPQTYKAFKDLWPVEEPTQQEISEAGSVEKAKINKTKALNTVCHLPSYLLTVS